ncbi:MAG: glycosyltransferase family 4 protein [Acidimicrobiia bacterium]|nr:glycosyltransferase family 4 protein [Acidimicrobiia bacterium]
MDHRPSGPSGSPDTKDRRQPVGPSDLSPSGADPEVTVAMVIHNYLPVLGGAQQQLNNLSPLFIERNIRPLVYTRSIPGEPATTVLNGVEVIRVRTAGPRPVQSIMFVLGTLWHLIRAKPDVVHAYDTLTPALIAGIYRFVSGTPYLTKLLRSGEMGDLNRLANKPLGRARLELLKRSVDRFVVISHDLEAELGHRGVGPDRRSFIPNGVDTERFGPPGDNGGPTPIAPMDRWKRRQECFPDWPLAPVVVVVGRVAPEKRVVELARRWHDTADDRPEAWLYVVGDGPQVGELDGLTNVRSLGNREDMPDIYRWSDVYVSASSAEGLSNALLEAMASGCPGVVTNVGGVGDVMTDGVDGLVIAAEGPGRAVDEVIVDVVDRVEQLLADPRQRHELGGAARRAVQQRYSLVSTAESLADEYRSLAADKKTRP